MLLTDSATLTPANLFVLAPRLIAALILAGGHGRRLGNADKAFVHLAGVPLLAHVLARLTPQTGQIAISANGDGTRFAQYGLLIMPDAPEHAGKGPLAGVAAGLAWAKSIGAAGLLTIPVDTPFIPTDLLTRLRPAPAVAVWQGRQHHLAATWPTQCLQVLIDFLGCPGTYKVRDALSRIAAAPVHFTEPQDPFHNINTPEDLAAAERLFLSDKVPPSPS